MGWLCPSFCQGTLFTAGPLSSPWPFGPQGDHSSQLVKYPIALLHLFLVSTNSKHIFVNTPFLKFSSVSKCTPSASCWVLTSRDLCTEHQGSCDGLFHLWGHGQCYSFSEMSPCIEGQIQNSIILSLTFTNYILLNPPFRANCKFLRSYLNYTPELSITLFTKKISFCFF